MASRRRDGRAQRAPLLGAMLFLSASLLDVRAQELCQTLQKCRRQSSVVCDRTMDACPPCLYNGSGNMYACFDKAPQTNTCPYTAVIYDCTGIKYMGSGNSSSDSTSTTTADAEASLPVGMYAAIGGGALLVLIIVIVVVTRRRRRGRNMPKFADSPQVFDTKRGAKAAAANTPYSNVPASTGKGPSHSHQRKYSDPVLLESSAVMKGAHQVSSDYSGNTATDSLDGMLALDNTPPPAVLGDPLPRTRSKRGFSSGFKRLNSGGSSKRSSSAYDVRTPSKNGPNVLGEYLKMKHEFDAPDAMSDFGSDTMSLDRFSVTSSITGGGVPSGVASGGHNVLVMSITDSEYQSEYQSELMRSRTESECFSEMSYNDEKYSFSDDAESVLSVSVVRPPPAKDKEVEI